MDKFPEAFNRFEKKSDIDISKVKDSNDLIRKFRYWNNVGTTTTKQDLAIKREARRLGIKIVRAKGISEKKGMPREKLKRRYGAVTYYTKKGKVLRIRPRDSKGRFTKK
jgi:hypothetical protein